MHRLRRDPVLLKEYDQIIREQERLGTVETVDGSQPTEAGNVHYLPHHPVIRRDKLTTKVRIVLDGPSRVKGPSLNSCLLAGQSLTPKIMDVWIRFRLCQVALAADIENAFLIVSVAAHERDCLRFLWFEDILADNLKMVIKRFTRAVFGVVSRPFLLNGTLKSHIESYLSEDPEFVKKILASLYVDDLNSGASTVFEAFELYMKSKSRMEDEGFNLRKWISNSNQPMSQTEAQEKVNMSDQKVDYSVPNIGPGDQTLAKYTVGTGQTKLSGQVDEQKSLGLIWNYANDSFVYVNIAAELPLTKRSVLNVVARLFDPLGSLSPIIVPIKVLFQELCASKCGWDSPNQMWDSNVVGIHPLASFLTGSVNLGRSVILFYPDVISRIYVVM